MMPMILAPSIRCETVLCPFRIHSSPDSLPFNISGVCIRFNPLMKKQAFSNCACIYTRAVFTIFWVFATQASVWLS
jgi:hypothetical protein